MEAKSEEKKKRSFRELPKRKKAWIAVAIALGVAAVIGGILAGVLVPLLSKSGSQAAPSYEARNYRYAVDLDRGERLKLPTDWILRGTLSDFGSPSLTYAENVALEKGYVKFLSMPKNAAGEEVSEFTVTVEYRYKDRRAAVINVTFLRGAGHITNSAELKAIDGKKDVYILDANLDLGGQAFRIERFGGRLFGNHHTISGFEISMAAGSKGGLFGVLDRAWIYSLDIAVSERSRFTGADLTFGVLADEAKGSRIGFMRLTGEIALTPMSGVNRIGGLVGRYSETANYIYPNDAQATMESCSSSLKMNVSNAGGRIRIGGLVGEAENVKLTNVAMEGALDVRVNGSQLSYFGYIGGIVGVWSREYRQPLRVNIYDTASGFFVTGKVSVTALGASAGNDLFIGGVAGRLANQQLNTARLSGELRVDSEGIPLVVGGIAGEGENLYATSAMEMALFNSGVTGEGAVRVASEGRIWAGGLFGLSKACSISDEVRANTPYMPQREGSGNHENDSFGEYYGRAE